MKTHGGFRAQITATGAYLPGPALDNATVLSLAGPLPDDVLEGLEVRTRHWIVDPRNGEHHDSTTGMAVEAALQALDRAGMEAAELDLLVTATSSPEYILPPMGAFLQERLGLERCALVELRGGCAAAVEGLDIARLYLERGQYRNALVVGSESISPLLVPVFLGRDPDLIRMRDRIVLYNFGDGAGAMVVRAAEDGEGLDASAMACIGGSRKPGMQIFGGGTSHPVQQQQRAERMVDLRLDAAASQHFTPALLDAGLRDILACSGREAGEFDLCIVPEGNAGYLVRELELQGGLSPEWGVLAGRVHENLAEVGATGCAALPLALDDAWRQGRLAPGDRVLLLAIETSKWIYAGMALTWTAQAAETRRSAGERLHGA